MEINLQEALYHRLSLEFSAFYGHLWNNQFSADEFACRNIQRAWQEAIRKWPQARIEWALNEIKEARSDFIDYPPTPIQFQKFCALCQVKEHFPQAVQIEYIDRSDPFGSREWRKAEENEPGVIQRAKNDRNPGVKMSLFAHAYYKNDPKGLGKYMAICKPLLKKIEENQESRGMES